MLLANELREICWPQLAGEYLIRHLASVWEGASGEYRASARNCQKARIRIRESRKTRKKKDAEIVLKTAPPWIFGHRGAAGLAPENTLPSITAGLEAGVDGIEIDVQFAHDTLWVLHDDTLDRTTTLNGTLAQQPIARLGPLVPTLSAVLSAVPPTTTVNIELKGPDTGAPVAELLARLPERPVLVSSFRWSELEAFRTAGGTAPIGVLGTRLTDAVVTAARALEAWSINLSANWLTRSAASRLVALGRPLLVYTVNEPAQARKFARWGASGFFTDRPDLVSRASLLAPEASPDHRAD